jgi:Leucine-rich repeat (LRR) protein
MTTAIVIECDFDTGSWSRVGNYSCSLSADPSITSPGVTVTSANGNHKPSMSHADVQGFRSIGATINFMPRGLNDIFPNLIVITINNAGMKELHQSDLKHFPRLRVLSLYDNAITIVEQNLFKFNRELEYINFNSNKIRQIHPTVFDHLNKLSMLWLNFNVCVDHGTSGRSDVVNLISKVKQECRGDFNTVE